MDPKDLLQARTTAGKSNTDSLNKQIPRIVLSIPSWAGPAADWQGCSQHTRSRTGAAQSCLSDPPPLPCDLVPDSHRTGSLASQPLQRFRRTTSTLEYTLTLCLPQNVSSCYAVWSNSQHSGLRLHSTFLAILSKAVTLNFSFIIFLAVIPSWNNLTYYWSPCIRVGVL